MAIAARAAKPKVDLLGREEGHAAFYLPPPRTLYSASASVRERRNNMQVRFQIIRNARISNVGEYQSCMVFKLRRDICRLDGRPERLRRIYPAAASSRRPESCSSVFHIIRNLETMHD